MANTLAATADYVCQVEFPKENDHALVVYCSDPYYMEGTLEFFRQHHGLSHFDQLIEPGGPSILALGSLSYLAETGNFKLLNGAHAFKRVIGVAHKNCAYYRTKYPKLDAEARVKKQLADLNSFAQQVQRMTPGVEVLLYFAEESDGHVQFTKV